MKLFHKINEDLSCRSPILDGFYNYNYHNSREYVLPKWCMGFKFWWFVKVYDRKGIYLELKTLVGGTVLHMIAMQIYSHNLVIFMDVLDLGCTLQICVLRSYSLLITRCHYGFY